MATYKEMTLQSKDGSTNYYPHTEASLVVDAETKKTVKEQLDTLGSKVDKAAQTSEGLPQADLDVSDEKGKVILRLQDGHIQTKNFDSSASATQTKAGLMSPTDKKKLDDIGEQSVDTKDLENGADLELTDEKGNAVARFINGHIQTKNFDSSKGISTNKDIRDYAKVLKMDKADVVAMVEASTNGRYTALYDDDGYPSLMYKIPLMSIGQFSQELDTIQTPHPAFVVGAETKPYIYISVFMTCDYKGHLVSWWGLTPVASKQITTLRSEIGAKGNGWHLETIYERSLLVLLTRGFNSPTPHCNNYWGMNQFYPHESVVMTNGRLPGKNNQSNGAKWINGTQPNEWSHNCSEFGIQDVCGGYHEIIDLVKMVNGKVMLAESNDYMIPESEYRDTGVAIDVINSKNVFSTSITSTIAPTDPYVETQFASAICDSSYDTISEEVRKLMVLLGICPRLSSSDSSSMFGYEGRIKSRPSGIAHFVMGGAEEYKDAGLGYYVNAYDLATVNAHNNMGSRIVKY